MDLLLILQSFDWLVAFHPELLQAIEKWVLNQM
jgi:hypothetical protein